MNFIGTPLTIFQKKNNTRSLKLAFKPLQRVQEQYDLYFSRWCTAAWFFALTPLSLVGSKFELFRLRAPHFIRGTPSHSGRYATQSAGRQERAKGEKLYPFAARAVLRADIILHRECLSQPTPSPRKSDPPALERGGFQVSRKKNLRCFFFGSCLRLRLAACGEILKF